METETKGAAIYGALTLAMKKVSAVGKSRRNQEQGYSFRGIDDIYNELHDVLCEAEVFTTCEILKTDYSEITTAKGSKMTEVRIACRWSFWAKDGSRLTHDTVGLGRDSGDKAANKAMSVAHKYALIQVLCIATEDAKDPEDDRAETRGRSTTPPAAPEFFGSEAVAMAMKTMEEAKNLAGLEAIYKREQARKARYRPEDWKKINATAAARKAELSESKGGK